MSDLLSAALGWPVLPVHSTVRGRCTCGRVACSSVAKHPRVPQGLNDASTDPAQVSSWWRRWPIANIGVRTGAVSGLLVVDIDGPEGIHAVKKLQHRHAPLPDTLWARTGGGGWHAFLAHPGGTLGNTAGRLVAHVDTRGDGGFVVAAPSLYASGDLYRWHEWPAQVAPAPAWLVELLRPPAPPPRQPLRLVRSLDAYAEAALRDECEQVATTVAGGRNHRLNVAAFALGQLVAAGRLSETAVRVSLLTASLACGLGASRCHPRQPGSGCSSRPGPRGDEARVVTWPPPPTPASVYVEQRLMMRDEPPRARLRQVPLWGRDVWLDDGTDRVWCPRCLRLLDPRDLARPDVARKHPDIGALHRAGWQAVLIVPTEDDDPSAEVESWGFDA